MTRPFFRLSMRLTRASRLLLLVGCAVGPAAPTKAAEAASAPASFDSRLSWWREARLGLFVHWGPVSLKGTEISWSRANSNPACPNKGEIPVEVYDNLYKDFNPTRFDADAWAKIAQGAGAKYIVLTAKHCDGFCLWHTQTTDYGIAATPFKRDVCTELARAARAAGLRVGWYYSPMDWRDPDCRGARNDRYVASMQAHLRELLTHYGRIDLLWFDTDGEPALWDQARTYALVRGLQPQIIINNRLDMGSMADYHAGKIAPNADYYTPEQHVGEYDDQQPWETCMTLGTQWSWKPDDQIKSLRETLSILVRCAGGDGNLLLNVGPMPTGEIEPRQVKVLEGLGQWLSRYGESIYGTRGGPFKPNSFMASTRKGNVVYLHLLKWVGGDVVLPALPHRVASGEVLTGGQVTVSQDPSRTVLTVSQPDPQKLDTIVKLTLEGPAERIPAVAVAQPGLIKPGMKATASNVYQNMGVHGPDKAIDGNAETRWATDAGLREAWLEVDLGRPMSFNRMELDEAFAPRIRKFALQYRDGDAWKSCMEGTKMADLFDAAVFEPVTARQVRLVITEASDGPTLWEFQLFAPAGAPR